MECKRISVPCLAHSPEIETGMAQLIQRNSTCFLALGIGTAIGVGLAMFFQKIADDTNRQLRQLVSKINILCREIESLKGAFGNNEPLMKTSSIYTTIPTSSGDEDEDYFEEALEESEVFSSSYNRQAAYAQAQVQVQERRGTASSALSNASKRSAATIQLFQEVDLLFDGPEVDKELAYERLSEYEPELVDDDEFMWRYAKATYLVAPLKGKELGDQAKKEAIYNAHDRAVQALTLNTNNYNVHKWYAITTTGVGDYESTQVKLRNGLKYKKHIEIAIELNPRDASSYYLLGRWLYAVYMLSWVEKKAASALFGSSISATVEDALAKFKKADELDPGAWKDNLLYIAKCHLAMSNYPVAVKWLDRAASVPTISQEDIAAQSELEQLIAKYTHYRE